MTAAPRDDAVHVCVRRADLTIPVRGSIGMTCDRCFAGVWVDPETCFEMGYEHEHEHVCGHCALALVRGADADISTTAGSVRRAEQHVREGGRWVN